MSENLWKRNSSGDTDSLPPRNQVIGINLANCGPYWSVTSWVVSPVKQPVGSLLSLLIHSTVRPLDGEEAKCLFFSSLTFLLRWGLEGWCHRALSCLVVYGRWDARGAGEDGNGERVTEGVLLPHGSLRRADVNVPNETVHQSLAPSEHLPP